MKNEDDVTEERIDDLKKKASLVVDKSNETVPSVLLLENKNKIKDVDNDNSLDKSLNGHELEQKLEINSIKQKDNNHHVEMMTLGSNNDVFMTTQNSRHAQAIYSSKELPQFLQDTLDQSLAKITISEKENEKTIEFVSYQSEESLPDLTALITKDLSEPYSIYTYRYFLHNWPQLSFLVSCIISIDRILINQTSLDFEKKGIQYFFGS